MSAEEYPCRSEKWDCVAIFDYVAGFSHLKSTPAIPCQDTALATIRERPIIIVSDGAGSCKLSHFGSNAVVRKLSCFFSGNEEANAKILDEKEICTETVQKEYAHEILKFAMQALREESEAKNDLISSFRCTLSVVVVGRKRSFWLRVGDSPIIVQRTHSSHLLGAVNKGEFSNQTSFLSEDLSKEQVQYGLIEMDDVKGFCSLSDGAAEKLISTNGQNIAPAIPKILDSLRSGELSYQDLHEFLSNAEFWLKTTGDDKSFAAIALQFNE